MPTFAFVPLNPGNLVWEISKTESPWIDPKTSKQLPFEMHPDVAKYWFISPEGTLVGYIFDGNSFSPPPQPTSRQLWQTYQAKAQAAIRKTDATMSRISESVALGLNSYENADIVAFVNYRRALRTIISSSSGNYEAALPIQPQYPIGT